MRKSRSIYRIFAIFFSLSVYGTSPGWYEPSLLVNNLQEYSEAYDSGGNLYLTYSKLTSPFDKNKSQNYSIELKTFGERASVIILQKFTLPSMEVIFSAGPTVAVTKKLIMVVWQEPSTRGMGMIFKYATVNRVTMEASRPVEIDLKDFDVFQPALYAGADRDGKDIFHLFFQKNLPEISSVSLAQSVYFDGIFHQPGMIIKSMETVGRGAFFPSILFKDNIIHIMYQIRQSDSLTDELYYIKSPNGGATFSNPIRITDNKYNDFSPSLCSIGKEIEVAWQSNQSDNWQVYYSSDLKHTERISTSLSNSYQPVIGYSEKTGKVIAWYDQRVDPAQIFARFINLDEAIPMSQEHQVTFLKGTSSNPHLVQLDKSLHLMFLNNSNLYIQKTDMETSPINISSPTHPQNAISINNSVVLNWKVVNEPSGIAGYAYLLDNRKDSQPDFYNLGGDSVSLFKKGLTGGNYFFHLKYKDKAGNESRVYHYPFSIDTANPILAEINSPTHAENTPGKKHEFKVNFSAVDDIGVKGYNYTFSANRAAKLSRYTELNDLTFSNLEDGNYYFLIQAIDKAGRTSPIVSYQINIVPEDYDDFRIFNNIVDGRVEVEYVDISVQVNTRKKDMKSAFAIISTEKQNPFNTGSKLEFINVGGIYKARIPIDKLKLGLYILSFGLEYGDGSKSSARTFHFEYYQSPPEPVRIVYRKKGKEDITKRYIDNPALVEQIRPEIELLENNGLYKITFSLPDQFKSMIEGFAYQVSSIPRLPDNDINYIEEPINLYDLSAGIYYISVKPVYKNEKIKKLSNYSYLRFVVPRKTPWQIHFLWAVGIASLLAIVIKLSKKLQFHLGKFT